MPLDFRHLAQPETSRARYDAAMADLERQLILAVNDEMHGQHVDRVHDVLVTRLKGRLPGAQVDEVTLHRIAAAIARGTLSV
jgi:hypothetical protein